MNTILEQINWCGAGFVEFAWPMLIQSSVLIVILLVADFLLRNKIRAVFRYCIWMLVLVKLVLPVTLSNPLGLGWFGEELSDVRVVSRSAEKVDVKVGALAVKIDGQAVAVKMPGLSVNVGAAKTGSVMAGAVPVQVTWEGVAFLVWCVAVLVMGVLLLQRAIFVMGLVAQAKESNELMKDSLEFCRQRVGVKGKVGLKVSANATSPAVCGLFRPVILVPENLGPSLGAGHLRAVLMHELVHVKRGDLWVNLVQTILQIAYFYNPLLWAANAIIRRVREEAVDEATLVAMGDKAGQYSQTLVDVAKLAFKRPALSLRLIGVVESKSTLKSRVKRILSRPIPKSAKLGVTGLLAVILVGVVLLPMAVAEVAPGLTIRGKVTDAVTGEPIAGAKVGDDKYAGGRQGTVTDSEGNYSYLTWHEEHGIAVRAAGYKVERKGLTTNLLQTEKEKVFNFALVRGNRKVLVDGPPVVVKTVPVAFAEDVSPGLKSIRVLFDQPMMDGAWSWTGTGGGETFPELTTNKPRYNSSRTTCTLPVKLEPGKVYWVGINSPGYKNFKTVKRVPAKRYVILFATKGRDGKATVIPADLLKRAAEINSRSGYKGQVEGAKGEKKKSANKSRSKIRREKIIEARSNPQIIHDVAYELFGKIKNADYDYFMASKNRDVWEQFPIVGYYNCYRDYPKLIRWICKTFKENPIVSIELGDVSFSEGVPRIYYELTLKDGAILEGDLHFEYHFYHGDKGRWYGIHGHFYEGPETPYKIHGLDWHLQSKPLTSAVDVKAAVEKAVLTISTLAETDPKVVESLELLQTLDESAVVANLVKYFDSDRNTIRRSAMYIVYKGGFDSIGPAVAALEKFCSHEEEQTRGMAALALGTYKVESSFDILGKMTLEDSSAYARRCGAYGLGLMGRVEAEPILEKALQDSDFNVRNNAEAALTMISQAAENEAEVSEVDVKVAGEFKAVLSDGVTVELVGVCYYPEGKPRSWRPDGNLLKEQIYVKRERNYKDGKYGFVCKVDGPEDLNFSWYKIEGSKGWWGSCTVLDSGGIEVEGYQAAVIKKYDGRETTNISVGIATGEWKTVASHTGRGIIITKGISFSEAIEGDGKVQIVVSDTPDYRSIQQRIVAIAKKGNIITTRNISSVSTDKLRQTTAKFYGLKLSEVSEFQFQTRPYEWVEFKNVSLKPGVKTDVQIGIIEVSEKETGDVQAKAEVSEGGITRTVEGVKKTSGGFGKARYEKVERISSPLATGSQVIADTVSGSIKVTGADVSECSIVATKRIKAGSEAEAAKLVEEVKVKVEKSGKRLSIKVERPKTKRFKNNSVGVDLDITVPRQTDVEGNTVSGSVKISDIKGDVEGNTVSGSVKIFSVNGNVEGNTVSGLVTAENIQGSADLNTASGSIRAENVSGSAKLNTVSGSIKCREMMSPELHADTASGSINIGYSDSAPGEIDVKVDTASGGIEVELPKAFSGHISMETGSGSIKTDLPIMVKGKIDKKRIEGTIGEGSGMVRLKTASGSIRLKRRSGTGSEVKKPSGQGQIVYDEKLNISIAIPADWQSYKSPSPGRYKFSWQLQPSKLKAWAIFIGIEGISEGTAVRQIADGDVVILENHFDAYTVRSESWAESTIGAAPAVSYVADYQAEGKATVEYRTYLVDESMVYWFVFRIEKDKFEAAKGTFDSIVNSFKLNVKTGEKTTVELISTGNMDREEIGDKLENLENQRMRVQRDLDAAEKGLEDVRVRWGIADLEEHKHRHSITERLIRLEEERDNCALQIKQLQAKIGNLVKQARSSEGKIKLEAVKDDLVALQSKQEGLEKMWEVASARKRDLDLARIEYKKRASIRDERREVLDSIKSHIEKLKLLYDEAKDKSVQPEEKTTDVKGAAVKKAVDSALSWLGSIDDEDYGKGWDGAAGMFKALVNKEQLEASLGSVRKPLGKLVSRKVKSKNYTTQVPGAPDGEYVIMEFDTSFENKKAAVETVVMTLDTNSQWRMSGYYIR